MSDNWRSAAIGVGFVLSSGLLGMHADASWHEASGYYQEPSYAEVRSYSPSPYDNALGVFDQFEVELTGSEQMEAVSTVYEMEE